MLRECPMRMRRCWLKGDGFREEFSPGTVSGFVRPELLHRSSTPRALNQTCPAVVTAEGSPFPKRLHQIWLSAHSTPPLHKMQTCSELHPSWEYRLWTVRELSAELPHSRLQTLLQHFLPASSVRSNIDRLSPEGRTRGLQPLPTTVVTRVGHCTP